MARTINGNLTGAAAHRQFNLDNLSQREIATERIKRIMGDDFNAWYDVVYDLRRNNKQAEYEAAIFAMLADIEHDLAAQDQANTIADVLAGTRL